MPDMTSLQNEERSLLNLVIAVSEIARQYIDDESRLPSGSIALLHQIVNRHIIGNNDKSECNPRKCDSLEDNFKMPADVILSPGKRQSNDEDFSSLQTNYVRTSPRLNGKLPIRYDEPDIRHEIKSNPYYLQVPINRRQGRDAEIKEAENPNAKLDQSKKTELVKLKLERANISLEFNLKEALVENNDTLKKFGHYLMDTPHIIAAIWLVILPLL